MHPKLAAMLVLAGAAGCAATQVEKRAEDPPVAATTATTAATASPAPTVSAASLQPLTALPYRPSLDVTSLDRSVDPCVDFYRFSCGGWIAHNPIPADQASWSVYAKLARDNELLLWGILEQDSRATRRTPVEQKVGDYFKACMNTPAIDAAGLAPIRRDLEAIAAIKTRPDVVTELTRLQHDTPGKYFFRAYVSQDLGDASRTVAWLEVNGLGIEDRDTYVRTDRTNAETRAAYVAFLETLLRASGQPAGPAATDAQTVLAIETELARASLTNLERRDPRELHHLMTLAELTALAPAFDWSRYFAAQGVTAPERLNVSEPVFLAEVQELLSKTPVADLQTYLRVHVLVGAAPFLARPFAQARFDFYQRTLYGVKEMPPRWKTCVRAVDKNLGEALGEEFVHRTFAADTKAKAMRMAGQIEAAMGREIVGLDWMSSAAKKEALRKLHVVRNKIGYPDPWRDYSALTVTADDYFTDVRRAAMFEAAREWKVMGKPLDPNEWGMSPPTVNAYFSPQMNDVNFPAGVLQPPLYDATIDDAPNYGDTGSMIGHELTHAFDAEGRLFDERGNLRDWWSVPDARAFDERLGCLREQYKDFVVIDDVHLDSRITSSEDVADLGGTWLAYLAWKEQTANVKLGDVEGFTPDQRFFIGMAQWACESQRPEALRSGVTDPHSPGFARIDGVVSNLPPFARAFGCRAGQPMVHAPVCKVW